MPGDHVWRAKIRRVIRGPDPIGGIKRVYLNLIAGLEKLGVSYVTNIPFKDIGDGDLVGVVGREPSCLEGYEKKKPMLAGVAVVEHPLEWPTLFDDHPVSQYVVHCDWVKALYERYYGPRVTTWAVGIDTDAWRPSGVEKSVDILIYDKIRWDTERVRRALLDPILAELRMRHLSYTHLVYGEHKPHDYAGALSQARAMLFLCEHETQGLAYQEAMSSGVAVLAWDPGQWLDPWRYRYGETYVSATSVPFFDERCGLTFKGVPDFGATLDRFWDGVRRDRFRPRDYVLENLTLEKCAADYVRLLYRFCG